ncbi:MAG: ABC transporter permease [Candidatus Omnitrophica bacterium]|nr:ABC transporter permease [Candidatus Omnitrophota bacterium]
MGPLLASVVGLLILFRIWVPNFLAVENLIDLTQQISVNAILALGMTLTILIGGIDLSVGAVVALVGTSAVFTLTVLEGSVSGGGQFTLGILAGLGAAMGIGLFNGLSAAKTRMPPFIITLATMQIARGLALRFNQGRPMIVPDSQTAFLAIGNGRFWGIVPYPVLIMLILFAIGAVILHGTLFGRHLYAIGGNRLAAQLSGVPVVRRETVVYILCALMAGVAGLIHASQLYSAEPASGEGFELDAIAAVVVGGTSFTGGIGTVHGTLIGAIIIGILDKGLNQAGVHFSLQYVVKGLVILGAVYLDVVRRR